MNDNGTMTMQQIADALGLRRLTVSAVINEKPGKRRVSEATAKRVRDDLDEIGYVSSKQAVSLRAKPSDVVGVPHTGFLYGHLTEAFNRRSSPA